MTSPGIPGTYLALTQRATSTLTRRARIALAQLLRSAAVAACPAEPVGGRA